MTLCTKHYEVPDCEERIEGIALDDAWVCLLTKHECYDRDEGYFDCACLLSAGMCPQGHKLKFVEKPEIEFEKRTDKDTATAIRKQNKDKTTERNNTENKNNTEE